jgi:ATP-dependent Lon protease
VSLISLHHLSPEVPVFASAIGKMAAVSVTGGTLAVSMVAQGLTSQTPNQLAWVIGGLITVFVAVAAVLSIYKAARNEVKAIAAEEAKVAIDNRAAAQKTEVERIASDIASEASRRAIDQHSKEAAQRTREAISLALKSATQEQMQALKDHMHEEQRQFDAIFNALRRNDEQNTYLIEMMEYIKGGSSPSVKKLVSTTGIPVAHAPAKP